MIEIYDVKKVKLKYWYVSLQRTVHFGLGSALCRMYSTILIALHAFHSNKILGMTLEQLIVITVIELSLCCSNSCFSAPDVIPTVEQVHHTFGPTLPGRKCVQS